MLEKSSLASSRMNKDPRIEPGTHVLKRFLQACLAFSSDDFEGPVFCTAVPENGNPRRRSHGGMEEGPFGGWCSRRPAMGETVGQPSTINGLTMVYCILYTVYYGILWLTI